MGAIRDLWLRWKMLHLPWRKTFLVGHDLYGNTFWQFRDQINHNRWRRMVKSSRRATLSSLSDLQISPQWHQWLRYTRHDAPTMQEQVADVERQAQLKIGAKMADERWAAKAKYIEKPKQATTLKLSGDPELDRIQAEKDPDQPPRSKKMKSNIATNETLAKKEDGTTTNPGSTWTPEAWNPGATRR